MFSFLGKAVTFLQWCQQNDDNREVIKAVTFLQWCQQNLETHDRQLRSYTLTLEDSYSDVKSILIQSRQRSGKRAIRKKFSLQKTEVGKTILTIMY